VTDRPSTVVQTADSFSSAQGFVPLRRRLFFGSAYAFFATIVGQTFALLTSVVYARLLGAHDLGVLAIYAQLASLAVAFAGLGLGTPITKFISQLQVESHAKLEKFLSTVLVIVLSTTAIVSIVLFLLAAGNSLGIYRSAELTFMIEIAAVFLVLNSLTTIGVAVLQGLQRIRLLSLVGIASEALTVPVMFISLSIWGLVGAALGGIFLLAVSACVLFGSAWLHLRRQGVRVRLSFDRDAARSLTIFFVPLLGSLFVVRIALLFQNSFLALALGYDETGLFRVALTVARVVSFVPGAISVPLLPAIAELYIMSTPERNRERLTSILRITACVGFPFALAIGLLASPIIVFLYGTSYESATGLAFLLVTAGFVDTIGSVAANSPLGEGRTRFLLVLDVGQSILLVVATVALVQWLGLLGIGYTAVVIAVAYTTAILILLGRSRRINLRRVVSSLLPACLGFGLAAIAIGTAGALGNHLLGAFLILASVGASWAMMTHEERWLLLRLVREVLRHPPRSE